MGMMRSILAAGDVPAKAPCHRVGQTLSIVLVPDLTQRFGRGCRPWRKAKRVAAGRQGPRIHSQAGSPLITALLSHFLALRANDSEGPSRMPLAQKGGTAATHGSRKMRRNRTKQNEPIAPPPRPEFRKRRNQERQEDGEVSPVPREDSPHRSETSPQATK